MQHNLHPRDVLLINSQHGRLIHDVSGPLWAPYFFQLTGPAFAIPYWKCSRVWQCGAPSTRERVQSVALHRIMQSCPRAPSRAASQDLAALLGLQRRHIVPAARPSGAPAVALNHNSAQQASPSWRCAASQNGASAVSAPATAAEPSRPQYVPNSISDPNYVRIFDTTLRDGEQSPGATLTVKEKLEIARQLAKLGVDVIEAGFPVASPGDFEAVRTIALEIGNNVDAAGYVPVICGLSRTSIK